MKELTVKALGKTVRVLNKSGAKDDIKDIILKYKGEISDENAFVMLVDVVSGVCMEKCYNDTIDLLGYLFEKTPAETEEMGIAELMNGFRTLAEENNLSDFFTQAFSAASRK